MSSLKNKIVSLFRSRKVNIFILFLGLALLFSLLTKLSKDYTETVQFNIQINNIPDDMVLVTDSLHKLDVTLTTYGFKFIGYNINKPLIQLDFKKLTKDGSYYYWTKNNGLSDLVSQLKSNVKIESVNPESIVFNFDKNASKMVPVILNSKFSFISGFDIVNKIRLNPDSIKVIGPQTLIDSVHMITTDTLVLTNVNKNIQAIINIDITNSPEQLKFSPEEILVNAKVEKFTEGSVDVPITMKNLPANVRVKYYPKKVKVFFYTSLSHFKNVNADDFVVICDFSKINETASFLTPQVISIPENVKNIRLETKRIEFITVQ